MIWRKRPGTSPRRARPNPAPDGSLELTLNWYTADLTPQHITPAPMARRPNSRDGMSEPAMD